MRDFKAGGEGLCVIGKAVKVKIQFYIDPETKKPSMGSMKMRSMICAICFFVFTLIIAGAALAGSPEGKILRLKIVSIQDRSGVGIGGEAFQLLIPEDWQTTGGVLWRHDLANLVTLAMRVASPNGSEAVEFFPLTPHSWPPPFGFAQGNNYLGNILLPPVDPAVYVQQMILPQFRRQVNARIIESQALLEAAQALAASAQQRGYNVVKADKVRLEYAEGGTIMHEDIYCVLVYGQYPTGTIWSADRLYSFKAPKGELDSRAALFQALVASQQINLSWFNKYLQVVGMWQQNVMASIQSAGMLSRYISQTYDEISAMNRQAWETYQASSDRINRQFSEYVRGVETYRNPFESRPVELPSGYQDVWANTRGEYILSDSPNFNPNVGSTQNWERLTKAQ
ncbi:MAG: hypothetical protein ALAOOOJD_04563 [bacterium]|nr:hypothetical protein [bacterium]